MILKNRHIKLVRSRRVRFAFTSVPLSAQIAIRKLQAITAAIGAIFRTSVTCGNAINRLYISKRIN